MSGWYGRRDETCPVSTGGRGEGALLPAGSGSDSAKRTMREREESASTLPAEPTCRRG